jgi:SAM-dependent methyltransferase
VPSDIATRSSSFSSYSQLLRFASLATVASKLRALSGDAVKAARGSIAARMPETPAMRFKDNAVYVTFKETRKALIRRIKLPKYRGDAYCCPVCGTSLKAFKPIWKSYIRKITENNYVYPLSAVETFNAESYSCPACDASDRERLYALYFEEVLGAVHRHQPLRMVEFAPSPALARKLRGHPRISYRTADLYRQTVDDRIDITDMGYVTGSVDIFLCSHVLEHVPDDRKAMGELFRVLRPGGLAIVMVPLIRGVDETHEDPSINTPELRWKYYGQDDHLRQYGKIDFVKRLAAAGFQVDQIGIEHFGADTFRRVGILPNSILYVARKPACT